MPGRLENMLDTGPRDPDSDTPVFEFAGPGLY